MYGFTGKILHVNLTTHSLEVEEPTEQFYRDYMGGSLMGLANLVPGISGGTMLLAAGTMLGSALITPSIPVHISISSAFRTAAIRVAVRSPPSACRAASDPCSLRAIPPATIWIPSPLPRLPAIAS